MLRKRILLGLCACLMAFSQAWGQLYQQPSSVQSQGGTAETQAGIYTHSSSVGQTAATAISARGIFSGNIGFLNVVSNRPPVAHAGPDQIKIENALVTLDGSASYDPDGDPLQYQWTSLNPLITLSSDTVEQPTFIAPLQLAQRSYFFALTVYDGISFSGPDTVKVTLRDTAWMPVIYPNSAALTGLVTLGGIPADSGDVVGAFVGGECRGLNEVILFGGQAYAIFNVQSVNSLDSVNFLVFDQSLDQICPSSLVTTSNPGGNIGSFANPFPIDGDCSQSLPVANFSASSNLICVGSPVTFQNNSINANTYFWDFGDGNTSSDIQPTHQYLNTGVYSVSLTAINSTSGLSDTMVQTNLVQVIGPPQLMPVLADTICIGGSTLLSTGGANTYSWSPGTGLSSTIDSIVTASPAVTTTYTVTGSNQCGNDSRNVTVTVSDISLNLLPVNPTCGLSNGSISGPVTGGIGNITYAWSNGGNTPAINALGAGNYSLTVTDQEGCSDQQSTTLTNIPGPTLSGTKQDPSCSISNGSITISASGGTTPITYAWSNGATGSSVSNLSPGNYTVIGVDSNNCQDTLIFDLVNIPSPSISVNSIDANCGTSNGSASAIVSGGVQPFTYNWSTGDTGQTVNGLAAGTYLLIVSDSNNCVDSVNVFINSIGAPQITLSSTASSCSYSADGSAAAIVNGGTSPYTYVWSNGANTATATNLTPGQYTVTVTDSSSCISTDTISVAAPPIIASTITETGSIGCYGENTGVLAASALGGTGSFTFVWNSGQTGDTLSQLVAGTYTVIVSDANGCLDSSLYTITQPDSLDLTFQSVGISCFGAADGSAQVLASGGTGAFSYLWNTSPQQTDSLITGLVAGTYSVMVTDANGCNAMDSVQIVEPDELTVSLIPTHITCHGGTDGSMLPTVNGGTGTYAYLWSTGDTIAVLQGVAAGGYSVTITDANGCTETVIDTVIEPDPIVLSVLITSNYNGEDISCVGAADGSIKASANGGTGTLAYTWNTSPIQNDSIVTGVSAGTYAITVTDVNGCMSIDSLQLVEPDTIVVQLSATQASCNGIPDGNVMSMISGGVQPYGYLWSNGSINPDLVSVSSGTYKLALTDANGCVVNDSVQVVEAVPVGFDLGGVDTLFCENGVLDAGSNWNSYAWNTGDTTQTIQVDSSQLYSVSITDADGCNATDSIQVIINGYPFASIRFDSLGLTISFNTANTTNATSYLWKFGDGDSSTQQNPQHTYDSLGVYDVILIASNPVCGSDTDTVYNIFLYTDLDPQIRDNRISIYPNPTKGVFQIDMEDISSPSFELKSFDAKGRLVYRNGYNISSSSFSETIDFQHLATGVYMLQMVFPDGSIVRKKIQIEY